MRKKIRPAASLELVNGIDMKNANRLVAMMIVAVMSTLCLDLRAQRVIPQANSTSNSLILARALDAGGNKQAVDEIMTRQSMDALLSCWTPSEHFLLKDYEGNSFPPRLTGCPSCQGFGFKYTPVISGKHMDSNKDACPSCDGIGTILQAKTVSGKFHGCFVFSYQGKHGDITTNALPFNSKLISGKFAEYAAREHAANGPSEKCLKLCLLALDFDNKTASPSLRTIIFESVLAVLTESCMNVGSKQEMRFATEAIMDEYRPENAIERQKLFKCLYLLAEYHYKNGRYQLAQSILAVSPIPDGERERKDMLAFIDKLAPLAQNEAADEALKSLIGSLRSRISQMEQEIDSQRRAIHDAELKRSLEDAANRLQPNQK